MTSEIPTPIRCPKEAIMSTPQTDELLRRIEQLEKSVRFWKRSTLAVVLVLLLGGVGLFTTYSVSVARQRATALAERDRAEKNQIRADEAAQRVLKWQAEAAKEGQK
jgi:hypothetical protein